MAYEWDNLFYACQLCNQQFKRNLFPLKDDSKRARSHAHSLSDEHPLLVDPSKHDTAAFISFREEYAYAVDNCPEGAVTIGTVLGLNREALAEKRRDRLADLKTLVDIITLLHQVIKVSPDAELSAQLHMHEKRLNAKMLDTAEYAAMARAYLAQASRLMK